MKLKTRVTITNPECEFGRGFGRGIAQLLSGIEREGSLSRVTKQMGMAYSKAWSILQQVEKEFDVQLVQRNGARGSELTTEGKLWLERYREMQEAAEQAAQQVFDKYYG